MNAFVRQGFVFTGKAKLRGQDVTRGELEAYVAKHGGRVGKKITSGSDILVASRSDTVKVRDAMDRGCRVCTYDDFFTMAGVVTKADLTADAPMPADPRANREQEQREARERIEAKKQARKREALAFEQAEQKIEGWGMF